MRRVLCAWFPHWALQRWERGTNREERGTRDKAEGEGRLDPAAPLVLYETRAPRPAMVCEASASALAEGVRIGMPLVEALALVSGGGKFPRLVEHDAKADRRALLGLAGECERFSPSVQIEEGERPESLLLEVGETAARLGGEAALAKDVVGHFAARGWIVRVAIADTLAAAAALARYGRSGRKWTVVPPGETAAALAPLPIEALRLPEAMRATLGELGLRSLGELERLPRAALPARWGRLLLDRLDQAHGRVGELAERIEPDRTWIARRELEFPLERGEALAAVAEALLRSLTEPMRRQGQGWWQLKCSLFGEQGPPRVVGLTLFRPSAQARYLRELFELRWERMRLGQRIVAVEVQGLKSGPLAARQRQWLTDPTARRGEIGQLVDRLVSRLGPSAVGRPELVPDADPQRAYRLRSLREEPRPTRSAARVAAAVVERPLRLSRRARRLEAIAVHPDGPLSRFTLDGRVHEVRLCDGPERIETGWWRGAPLRRDYYRVETAEGMRAWVYRDEVGWWKV